MEQMYRYQKDERAVGWLTLDRPAVRNAFNDQLIARLTEVAGELAADKSLRLLVLQGAGKIFCAGADVNWMKTAKDKGEEENYQDAMAMGRLFEKFDELPFPTLARVQGAAMGGACGLLSVCDHVIAARDTKMAFSEVKLGIAPAVISPFVFAKIGQAHARAWFLSGQSFSAHQAFHMGLIHQVAPAEKLDEVVQETVSAFLQAGPSAARETKKLLRDIAPFGRCGLERPARLIAKLRASEEGQEGMGSLLEKRPPNWVSS